ncbi:hypothetical protein [Gracilibacillus xinjiangensis]|uniref:Lipoprotein n=1 Tax=Gracilibacillus xinjiangensis TaxID=1193282 RepID=A0ABV8WYT0_9BACI
MKKNIVAVFISLLIITAGCSVKQEMDKPTIAKSPDSQYETTLKELGLGMVFNFDFYLPSADERWVTLWVERYKQGEKEADPVAKFSFGNSPNEVDEGALGFGIINPGRDNPLVFLYAPGVTAQPAQVEKQSISNHSSWDYALGDEEIELDLGEATLLAAYRETEGNSIEMVDLQDERSVNKMIHEDEMVLLFKIMVEKEGRDNQ